MDTQTRRFLPRGAGLTQTQINLQVHFSDDPGLVYLQNNKAACTSIKYSILRAILPDDQIGDDSLNARRAGPFRRYLMPQGPEKALKILERPVFTAVRNPYARVLSAYLNKIRPSDPVGRRFHARFYLEPEGDERIGFADFLRCIASEHPRACDPHLAPQYVNTLVHHVDHDFLGSIEDIGGLGDFLAGHGVTLEHWRNHATRALTLLEAYFSDEATALAEEIYAPDFELFGYRRGLARAAEPPRAHTPPPAGARLAEFVTAPEGCAQPDMPELEALRRFGLAGDHAERRAIAEGAVALDDRIAVEVFATAMGEAGEADLAAALRDRLTLLLTGHMDQIPERLLSEQGLTMKRRREEILAR